MVGRYPLMEVFIDIKHYKIYILTGHFHNASLEAVFIHFSVIR